MREFILPLRDAFRRGLRQRQDQFRGLENLTGCTQLVPRESGLVYPGSVSNPFTGVSVSFPFPQFFRGMKKSLLADETSISLINESAWTTAAYTLYDSVFMDSSQSIDAGGTWHFADFGDAWYLFNGQCVVFTDKFRSLKEGVDDNVYVDRNVSIGTGCNFNGLLLYGGLDADAFWSGDWETFWSAWANQYQHDLNLDIRPEANYVGWCPVGGDLRWLFGQDPYIKTLVESGTYDVDRPYILDLVRTNQLGFAFIPCQGQIYAIKPFRDRVIVYAEDGVFALTPMIEPMPGFSVQRLLRVGPPSRGAVGGDLSQHLFFDTSGCLYRLDSEGIQRLDYREFFSSMTGNDVVITREPNEGDYYISDGSTGYVLTQHGLAQMGQLLTSVHYIDGTLYGLDVSSSASTSFELTTNAFDMGYRDIKTIGTLELSCYNVSSLQYKGYYRYDTDDSWTATDWIDASSDGMTRLPLSGTDFKIGVKGTCATRAQIDALLIHWQATSKRFQRGAYASTRSS